MCWMLCCCCGCLCGPYKCTFIAAVLIAIESIAFAAVNVCVILMHQCVIEPPNQDQLPSAFFEKVWSWFIYDEDSCNKTAPPPQWIIENPVPDEFYKADGYNGVTSTANYAYQITFLTLNLLWFLTSFVLIYGNARKKPGYYLPFLLTGVLVIGLDISIGGVYIKFISDVHLDWVDESAIFFMIYCYFRGFFFVIFNILEYLTVLQTYFITLKKRKKEAKRIKKANEKARRELQKENPAQTQPQVTTAVMKNNAISPQQAPSAAPSTIESQIAEEKAKKPVTVVPLTTPGPSLSKDKPEDSPHFSQKASASVEDPYRPPVIVASPYNTSAATPDQHRPSDYNQEPSNSSAATVGHIYMIPSDPVAEDKVSTSPPKMYPGANRFQPFSYLNPDFQPETVADIPRIKSSIPSSKYFYYDNPAMEREPPRPSAPLYPGLQNGYSDDNVNHIPRVSVKRY